MLYKDENIPKVSAIDQVLKFLIFQSIQQYDHNISALIALLCKMHNNMLILAIEYKVGENK